MFVVDRRVLPHKLVCENMGHGESKDKAKTDDLKRKREDKLLSSEEGKKE